ncbi:hypothetical protein LZ32DRAFT_370487 [Colletotrichum eremochloae]|nr:hypothetical protein LZ32DRAFT_370487 [Colletotrichum eremochloae]
MNTSDASDVMLALPFPSLPSYPLSFSPTTFGEPLFLPGKLFFFFFFFSFLKGGKYRKWFRRHDEMNGRCGPPETFHRRAQKSRVFHLPPPSASASCTRQCES